MNAEAAARFARGNRAPRKHRVLDVGVSAVTYDEAVHVILAAARERTPLTVDHMSVHGLVAARKDPAFRQILNDIDIVAPDGQPVRWALDRLHGTSLPDRVYGPELMSRLCQAAAGEDVGIYLYGGTEDSLTSLRARLAERHRGLHIAGFEAPPFRPLSPEEDRAAAERINASGAGLVFIGLGCPKQEIFAHRHRRDIHAVQLCVGAAFDFHAGRKKMAPRWMQDRGLEWVFRLASEPRRLARRYMVHNSLFVLELGRELLRRESGAGNGHEQS